MINSLKVKLLNSLCTMYFKYTQVGTIVLTIWSRFFFYLSNRLIFTHGHILHMDIFYTWTYLIKKLKSMLYIIKLFKVYIVDAEGELGADFKSYR